MKKGVFALIVFVILIIIADFVSVVSSATIKADGKEYKIELTAVNRESALITINNESKILRNIQSSPYVPEFFSSSFPELKYAMTDMHYGDYLGDIKYVNLLIFIEKNLSLSGIAKVIMSYDTNSWTFEVPYVASINQANVRLNNGSNVLATVQSLPYSPEKISPMSDFLYVLKSVDSSYANILLGFEMNLLFECSENWNCSNWSSCIDSKQTRECKDSNNCGTKKNIPDLTQDCESEQNILNNTICTDKCPLSSKICFNDTSFKSCLDIDNDNCTEWSSIVSCPNMAKCSGNGECLEMPESKNNSFLWILLGISASIIVITSFVLTKSKISGIKKKSKKKKI